MIQRASLGPTVYRHSNWDFSATISPKDFGGSAFEPPGVKFFKFLKIPHPSSLPFDFCSI